MKVHNQLFNSHLNPYLLSGNLCFFYYSKNWNYSSFIEHYLYFICFSIYHIHDVVWLLIPSFYHFPFFFFLPFLGSIFTTGLVGRWYLMLPTLAQFYVCTLILCTNNGVLASYFIFNVYFITFS